uniref:Uncharacterized protein n=1 Tax=Arundo donax TaxID=35708 RepID=A0A0A8ZZJ5_ARUDO
MAGGGQQVLPRQVPTARRQPHISHCQAWPRTAHGRADPAVGKDRGGRLEDGVGLLLHASSARTTRPPPSAGKEAEGRLGRRSIS